MGPAALPSVACRGEGGGGRVRSGAREGPAAGAGSVSAVLVGLEEGPTTVEGSSAEEAHGRGVAAEEGS